MPRLNLLSLAIAVSLTTPTTNLLAIGFGNPDTAAILNRPLNISLPIIATEYELHDIRARIANEQQHNRFGLNYPLWIPKLKFNAVETNSGPMLQITSHYPIKEPVVNFVVAIDYKGTTIFKEIALFMDPAELYANNQRLANVTNSQQSTAANAQTNRITTNHNLAKDIAVNQDTPKNTSIIPQQTRLNQPSIVVEQGQSLWRIARSWEVEHLTLTQKMQVIFDNNPHAFLNEDKNQLKLGVTLYLDTNALDSHSPSVNEPNLNKTNINTPVAKQQLAASSQPVDQQRLANRTVFIEQELSSLKADIEYERAQNAQMKQQLAKLEGLIAQLQNPQQMRQYTAQIDPMPAFKAIKDLSHSALSVISESSAETPAETDGSNNQSATQLSTNASTKAETVNDKPQVVQIENAENTTLNNSSNSALSNRNNLVPSPASQNSDQTLTTSTDNGPSFWQTFSWLVIALLLAYLGSRYTTRRKVKRFTQELDDQLETIASNQQQDQSKPPSVRELSIPKNVSTSAQIKYLRSAADFYLSCNRYDLAKELVNESLIQYSGNTRIVQALLDIRKNIYTELDSNLKTNIVAKLDTHGKNDQSIDNSGLVFTDDEDVDLDTLNDEFIREWNEKVSSFK
ncbi:FimV family protein [Aliikangiella maris]|uniref:Uncharacterized protein n=2 Tax=Aliikangiella maris TaxID=3162458 RepID=A0ABV3MTY1_9GAMM